MNPPFTGAFLSNVLPARPAVPELLPPCGRPTYTGPLPSPSPKWFEAILKAAKDDYVFSVTSYPGYTTHKFGRGMKGHKYDQDVLHPLLAKYKATGSLGCTGKYEYIPAANDKAVPSIITGGVGSPMASGWTQYNYCVVEIKDGKCMMRARSWTNGHFPRENRRPKSIGPHSPMVLTRGCME